MGNVISQQLALFFRSILLGGTLALVYDLVGALRSLGGRIWGGILDTLYCLAAAGTLFLFVMAGDGELQIFILLGVLGGAVLFFCLLSQVLRPLWTFWLGLALIPVRLLVKFLKKVGEISKKLFSFSKNWFTIMGTRWRRSSSRTPTEGDEELAQKAKKRPNSKLTALLLVVLLLGITVQLFHLRGELRAAQEEEAVYTARLATLQATNAQLAADIANSSDPDLIQEIAREDLGMVEQGEKIFRFGK